MTKEQMRKQVEADLNEIRLGNGKGKEIDGGDKVKLSAFVEEEKNELDEFLKWWEEKSLQNSMMYPPDMALGEWWEQFVSFCEMSPENRLL